MKTPQLWVTIDKRGFSKEGLKKLLEYNIAGIRMNTGRIHGFMKCLKN